MKSSVLAAVVLLALAPPAERAPAPLQALFGALYAAVEMLPMFPDSKEFADAIPKSPPAAIMALYDAQQQLSAPALRAFVEAHFTLPPAAATPAGADSAPLRQHIDALWVHLVRDTPTSPPYSSLLPTPRPYVAPGGRFRELYYWDSYFTMLGLAESGRADLIADMVADFAHFLDAYGRIPNGARSYYLTRSQPPLFFAMVGLLAPDDPAAAWARFLPQLKREYAFWMAGASDLTPGAADRRVVALDDGGILNRYWDDSDAPRDESFREDVELARASQRPPPGVFRDLRAAAESGWDFSSRWLADRHSLATIDTTQIIPVDLNALLFGLEEAIRAGCARAGDSACAAEYAGRAAARRVAIDRYLWDDARGAYYDYRWTARRRLDGLSAAALYPLFTQAASPAQAGAVAQAAEQQLLKAGGLVATPLVTGQQWDAPNGWAPLQWIAAAGLRSYGLDALAEKIACRWMVNVGRVYRQTGKLVEKYDVIAADRPGGGGEYPTQDGFGWTNGVTRKFMALYPRDAAFTRLDQCPG
jgi:alpha,alpha-trehalase